jgi:hypothetical protein
MDDSYTEHDEHDDELSAEGHDDENGRDEGASTGAAETAPAKGDLDKVAPAAPPPPPSQPEADRGPFSFFSWMRRESQIPAEPRRRDDPEER